MPRCLSPNLGRALAHGDAQLPEVQFTLLVQLIGGEIASQALFASAYLELRALLRRIVKKVRADGEELIVFRPRPGALLQSDGHRYCATLRNVGGIELGTTVHYNTPNTTTNFARGLLLVLATPGHVLDNLGRVAINQVAVLGLSPL